VSIRVFFAGVILTNGDKDLMKAVAGSTNEAEGLELVTRSESELTRSEG
jgi:hypothetical protein